MSYAEFLIRPYNLPFLLAIPAGLAAGFLARRWGGDGLGLAVGLVAAGACGLSWNGAIHDLGLGSPARRLPLVLPVSAAAGALVGAAAVRLRNRWFPPVRGVELTAPGHEGTEAVVVSRETGPGFGSGRAQWRDASGVLHLVRCHTGGERLRFGRRVRLGAFDERHRSYAVAARAGGRGGGSPAPHDSPLR